MEFLTMVGNFLLNLACLIGTCLVVIGFIVIAEMAWHMQKKENEKAQR